MPRVLVVGGCDVHLRLDLMKALRDEFAVAAVGSAPELRDRFSKEGFTFHSYPLGRRANPAEDLDSAVHLFHLFRRLRPDIVHTFATKPSVWGRIAAKWAKVPVVIGTLPGLGSLYATNDAATRLLRMAYRPLQRLACTVSDLTIFQNWDDARDFVGSGIAPREKVKVVLGSGVRTEVFDRARVPEAETARIRAEMGATPATVVVTMVSRLIRLKGVLEFAEAGRLVREQAPDVEFVLVGPDDRECLDRLSSAELERLRASVRWLGPREDVNAILAASDVFVLPSFYREGIPRVLLEASSMGLPIVTTRSPGCVEVVEDGHNGFLVPPRDSAALAEAILKLVRGVELRRRFGEASRKLAVRRFDLAVVREQTGALYRELLSQAVWAPLPSLRPVAAERSPLYSAAE